MLLVRRMKLPKIGLGPPKPGVTPPVLVAKKKASSAVKTASINNLSCVPITAGSLVNGTPPKVSNVSEREVFPIKTSPPAGAVRPPLMTMP